MTREEQLAANLAKVRNRISQAVAAAGRSENPRLIVVTKYFPASDVRILSTFGIRDFGENRDQEAGPKADELKDLDLSWHFIGQLQGNKAKSVVRYASAVHSVDRPSLIKSLTKAMEGEQIRREASGLPHREALDCYLQVNLDPRVAESSAENGRGGTNPRELESLADAVERSPSLDLAGVMAVAPLGFDASEAFNRLRELSNQLQRSHPRATGISAGMSTDLEEAVSAGATHLRIGSDILGARAAVR